MGLESATFIDDLDETNPESTDLRKQGDDHLRLIKSVLKSTFPSAPKAFYFPSGIDKTGNFVILSTQANKIFRADASGAAFTLTLPTLTSNDDGWAVIIIKTDSSAHAVTIGGTVNGATGWTLADQYESRYILWDGSRFNFLGTLRPTPGSWEKIDTVTDTGASGLEFTDIDTDGYDEWEIRGEVSMSDVSDLNLLVGTGAGPTYLDDYSRVSDVLDDTGGLEWDDTSSNSSGRIVAASGVNGSPGGEDFRIHISTGDLSTNDHHRFIIQSFGLTDDGSPFFFRGIGQNNTTGIVTALRLEPDEGGVTITGTLKLYGRRV